MRYPKHFIEVGDIVNEAIARGVKVKAVGRRHSQTDIICTEGIPIDMTGLKFLKMNDDNTTTFGAGVTVREAGDFLLPYKRALIGMPAFGNITLGGAIGTGAHGSSIKFHSSISAQVARMTIIDGSGKIQTISNPEDLKSFKTHLGLLGMKLQILVTETFMIKAQHIIRFICHTLSQDVSTITTLLQNF